MPKIVAEAHSFLESIASENETRKIKPQNRVISSEIQTVKPTASCFLGSRDGSGRP